MRVLRSMILRTRDLNALAPLSVSESVRSVRFLIFASSGRLLSKLSHSISSFGIVDKFVEE